MQDTKTLETDFRADTIIDNFSAIGGFFGFIYGLIYLVIGSYEEFAYESAIRRRIYTQNKKKTHQRGSMVYENGEYQGELEDTILNRKSFEYFYSEYLATSCMLACCCCFRSRECYKRRKVRNDIFEEANDRLSGEIDILHFV